METDQTKHTTMKLLPACIERFLKPGYSTCGRCDRPWKSCSTSWLGVEPHSTTYSTCLGCLPLCETCWQNLTPETRLPYYENLMVRWEQWGPVEDSKKQAIRQAVAEGK